MKTINVLFLVSLFCFIANQSFAQAEVTRDDKVYSFKYLEDVKKGKDILWVTQSHGTKTTISSSGNILKTIYFQLEDDHPLMGMKLIIGIRLMLDDGTIASDEKVEIKKNGSFSVVFHSNGAGSALPLGW